jgi:two-component system LytT family response regulator
VLERVPDSAAPARAGVSTTGSAPPATYVERIAVEVKGKVRPVPVSQIDYITADGPYAELHVAVRR